MGEISSLSEKPLKDPRTACFVYKTSGRFESVRTAIFVLISFFSFLASTEKASLSLERKIRSRMTLHLPSIHLRLIVKELEAKVSTDQS